MMYLDQKFDHVDSLDYSLLPSYGKLSEEQQKVVSGTYSNAYRSAVHLGQQIALGKAYETARAIVEQLAKETSVVEQAVPPSIFAGLANCE